MDIREIYKSADKMMATHNRNMEIVANFEKQWLHNDYVLLDDLACALAQGVESTKDIYSTIFLEAIKNKSLTVWHADKSHILNTQIALRDYKFIPKNTFILKNDFIGWWQQEKSVPIPESLKNIIEPHATSTMQQLIDENQALKTKIAELEQRLTEYKELPTQTKNKVMPVIYGLSCLYFNKGKPLTKTRGNCDAIAKELKLKFGIDIGDKGLENYYNTGKTILGRDN